VQQLAGLARPATGWERDYLPARVDRYDGSWLTQLASRGSIVWAGVPRADTGAGSPVTFAAVRFFERGTGALWLSTSDPPALSDAAAAVRDALARQGASFLAELQSVAGLGPLATRDALRELAAAGLVTNDTIEALREVIRTRALPVRRADQPDPTRWLPAEFTPSVGRVVHHRVNITRLPRWRRPDHPGPAGAGGWVGRWSLLVPVGLPVPRPPEEEQAADIARQWLARYGVVARDWWRRERPPVGWRAIYRELKRLEYRGEVRRGYFVEGLGGAQFAMPEAVERLRAVREEADAPFVALAASDPANVYNLPRSPLETATESDPLTRPRGAGAVIVTHGGVVVLAAEGRGRRVRLAPGLDDDALLAAVSALTEYLARGQPADHGRRARTLDTIDGAPAATSPRVGVFHRAGLRLGGLGLDYT
jgi:ATP-dependent helicase Lhr and Lhr-like helicase